MTSAQDPALPTRRCDQVQACVAIPVYNNVRTVAAVVEGALAHASTVLVCDDGSTDGSGEAAAKAGATVLTLPRNEGKGAALKTLLAEAARRGHRYAICLDADGQHLPSDLPALVEQIEQHPGALVTGARDMAGAGAPGSSQFGFRFSNFWIWFGTGVRLADSQCGFRAYPLRQVLQLPMREGRYEFETEVLLRAAWAGVPLAACPVGVVYPPDRVTHFRLFLDNVRISLVYTLAVLRLWLPLPLGPPLGPLPHRPGLSGFALRRWAWLGAAGPGWRLAAALLGATGALFGPRPTFWLALFGAALAGVGALPAALFGLLARLFDAGGQSEARALVLTSLVALGYGAAESVVHRKVAARRGWDGRNRGGVLGHWFFVQVTRLFGALPAYLVLYPVALYFTFTDHAARGASAEYLDRVLGPAHGLSRFTRVYRHFLAFARTLVDKALLGARGAGVLSYTSEGLEHISQSLALGKGVLLLTAHVGNWEIAGSLLKGKMSAPFAIVAYVGEEERLRRYLDKRTGPKPRVIAVGSSELSSLEILRALREGTLVAIQGDRALDGRVARVPFFGGEASFPVGPFVIAALSGAPVIATFSMQVGRASYRFIASPPMQVSFQRGVSRDAQLQAWVAAYARHLEALIRQYPFQWFNFYDFWNPQPPGA